jgi:hypothetical protein
MQRRRKKRKRRNKREEQKRDMKKREIRETGSPSFLFFLSVSFGVFFSWNTSDVCRSATRRSDYQTTEREPWHTVMGIGSDWKSLCVA